MFFVSIDGYEEVKEPWRKSVKDALKKNEDISFFDPLEPMGEVLAGQGKPMHKASDNMVLYVITPGVNPFLAAEITRRALTVPEKTIMCLPNDKTLYGREFTTEEIRGWGYLYDQLKRDDVFVCHKLSEAVAHINEMYEENLPF